MEVCVKIKEFEVTTKFNDTMESITKLLAKRYKKDGFSGDLEIYFRVITEDNVDIEESVATEFIDCIYNEYKWRKYFPTIFNFKGSGKCSLIKVGCLSRDFILVAIVLCSDNTLDIRVFKKTDGAEATYGKHNLKKWKAFTGQELAIAVDNGGAILTPYRADKMKIVSRDLVVRKDYAKSDDGIYMVPSMRGRNLFGDFEDEKVIDLQMLDLSEVSDLDKAFKGIVRDIQFPINGKYSSMKTMRNTFTRCKFLKIINLSNTKFDELVSINAMCKDCKSLKKVELNGMNAPLLQDVSRTFDGCVSLEEIDLSNAVFGSSVKMNHTFRGCKNLKVVNVHGCDSSLVKSIRKALYEEGLQTVKVVTGNSNSNDKGCYSHVSVETPIIK